jgi:hypothetical protein
VPSNVGCSHVWLVVIHDDGGVGVESEGRGVGDASVGLSVGQPESASEPCGQTPRMGAVAIGRGKFRPLWADIPTPRKFSISHSESSTSLSKSYKMMQSTASGRVKGFRCRKPIRGAPL